MLVAWRVLQTQATAASTSTRAVPAASRAPCTASQQRLGRDARPVRALTSDQLALDDRDAQAALCQGAGAVLARSASIMHALAVPAKVIASRRGHADTQVLFRRYIKEFDAQDREPAAILRAGPIDLAEQGFRTGERRDGEDRRRPSWTLPTTASALLEAEEALMQERSSPVPSPLPLPVRPTAVRT